MITACSCCENQFAERQNNTKQNKFYTNTHNNQQIPFDKLLKHELSKIVEKEIIER